MKKLVLSTLFVLQAFLGLAQQGTGISGKVVDSKTNLPLQNVVTSIANTNFTQLTDEKGEFKFTNLNVGNQLLQIKSDGYKDQLFPIEIVKNQILDLGTVVLEADVTSEQQLSLVTLTENDLSDDNSGSENTSGLLQSSRDAFQQVAAFNWGQARFRMRGLDSENATTMINGIAMNKIYDGRPQWGNWGGLNDATRNQEFTYGSGTSDYTFGGILGTQEINTRASIYRPGNRISFSGANTNYNWRGMFTHASGLDNKGWAFIVSASGRIADEAHFEGTTYDAKSLFAAVEKRFNDKHSLNFTAIYAENKRGKNSPNTDEVTNLAGYKYNSYWGFQGDKKRNSREKNLNEPIMILSHYWKFNNKTSLNTNVAYQTGSVGNSRIDYQGAPNPDPTYYRNLPSYFTSQYDPDTGVFLGNTPANIALANSAKFLTSKQVDWEYIYRLNRNTNNGRSAYILYEDRTDDTTISANTIFNSQLSENITMNAGFNYKNLKSRNFQNLLDLLGGKFYEDFDNFQQGDMQQSDLNNPNRIVTVGDKFGYNYNLLATTYDAFTQFKFNYKKFDFYLAQNFIRTEYQREGLYKNGIYPTNSFGKSDKITFDNFGFKGGLTFKLSSRHLFDFNAAYLTKAPTLRNSYPNVRLNDNTTIGLSNETIYSADGSYVIRTPKLKMRLTGYFNATKNATKTAFFFADGVLEEGGADNTDAFVSETVTGMNKKNFGGEFGIEWNITSTIKATGAAAYGQGTYDNNPTVYLNNDSAASLTNTNPIINYGTASLKGYRLAGSPQQAYSVGLEYRDPHYWWIGVNGNYLDDNYLDISEILRTQSFYTDRTIGGGVPYPEVTPERTRELLKQEKFDRIRLVNLTGGKSWRIKKSTLGFFASVNNVFDEKYKTGGFEQARNANFRELNQDVSSGTPSFGPKYFYGYGRTYFVNLYINF